MGEVAGDEERGAPLLSRSVNEFPTQHRHGLPTEDDPLPLDLRVLLPGYSDELAFSLGLVDFDGSLAAARRRFQINGRSRFGGSGKEWSRQIRMVAGGANP